MSDNSELVPLTGDIINAPSCNGPYPVEDLNDDDDYPSDDGTMVDNVQELRDLVVGHRIVKAEQAERVKASEFLKPEDGYRDSYAPYSGFVLTLDNGHRVLLENSSDCCAFTSLETFLLHPERVDHIITGIGTTEGYTKWHIFADLGDVLELEIGWSSGNPFYYGYGFDIYVSNVLDAEVVQAELPAGGK